ncbi:alpha/beta fold hydrolase [Verminephrobacter eiseniae]|uniref:alpha/beta fold hydrolase n=1 Tax=Verminephrobacter eiseniae TaxID=364317 RepID=UPI002238A7E5|nr:alpha/beta hydrolase [Verminephrobacter eiseniae]MCW5237482.1 alpha/beta hydrolase [Verminephrobacter eiseniae]
MTKPILLLLPGLLCDRTNWAAQCADLAELADCHVPVYSAFDSIESMAEHVLRVAPSARFALAGHSMGGRVALEVIRRAPERVERIALLDTGFQPLPQGEHGERERVGRYRLLSRARTDGMRAMGEHWARGMVHPSRVDTPLFEAILDMIGRNTPQMFESQIRALLGRPDATSVLPGIRCPTLLLCGRDDLWSPLVRHEEMQRAIPTAQLKVIEDSGHMTTMEQPQAVSTALAEWLRDSDGAIDKGGRNEDR